MERLLDLALRTRRLPALALYTGATALVLIAFGLHAWVLGADAGYPFVTFYPAVALASLVFDRGTGLFATVLSALLVVYSYIPPTGELAVATQRDAVGLLVFLGTAAFIAVLVEAMCSMFARMTESQRELEQANSQLQGANAQLQRVNEKLLRLEQETGLLLHETIHRFRNDLQRLSSTVALQMSSSSDPAAKAALVEVQGRIGALAAIKARLDVALTAEGATSFVESQTFLSGLVEDWETAAGIQPVLFRAEAESHLVPAGRAVLLGLILNELMTNAVKYAFADGPGGSIGVTFRREGDHYELIVEDDGVGHDPTTAPKGSGLGRRITQALATQMGGRIEIGPRPGGGTICALRFPVSAPAE